MKSFNSYWLAAALALALLAGLTNLQAAEQEKKDKKKEQSEQATPPPRKPVPDRPTTHSQGQTNTQPTPSGSPSLPTTRPGGLTTQPPTRRPGESGIQRTNPAPGRGESATTTPSVKPPAPPVKAGPTDSTTTTSPVVNKPPPPAGPTSTPPRPAPAPALTTQARSDGSYEKMAPSGKVRERMQTEASGVQRTQQITTTGRVEKEIVQDRNGSRRATEYDLGHREKRVEVVNADRSKQTTEVHYNRNGEVRSRESIKVDARGAPVSKTIEAKQNVVINTTTIKNKTVVKNYYPGRYGYVYAPVVVAPVVYTAWYDPFWYASPVVVGGPYVAVTTHHFAFSWGWTADPWYAYHRAYWAPYPVYVAPSYWVTDWVMAGYLADRYAVTVSAEQTREEVRLARDEAEKAKLAAQQAKDAAEIAEAKAAQTAAEARAERAEARAQKAEADEARPKELAGKPNPKATPIDNQTKEALKNQVEQTIAEKKVFADQSAKGGKPVPPDVSIALADPKHIYPVSKNLSVTRAEDAKNAGTLTAGDLLTLAPGQENTLKDASENTLVNMRVMTSKGEDDSVPAGTVIAVPLKDLQDFDSEFRAKLDLALAEADKNKDEFKKAVQ